MENIEKDGNRIVTQEMVYNYLFKEGPKSTREIANHFNVDTASIHRKLHMLYKYELISRTKEYNARYGINVFIYKVKE